MISNDFQGIFGGFLFEIHLITDVFQIFVIMVLSRSKLRLFSFQYVFKCVTTHILRCFDLHSFKRWPKDKNLLKSRVLPPFSQLSNIFKRKSKDENPISLS